MSYLSQALEIPKPASKVPTGGLAEVGNVIKNSFTWMIVLAIILVLFVLVWSGIQWITSGGDKTKVAAAKARLTWAIVGLVIVLGSFFIVAMLGYFFKVDLLNFNR